MRMRRRRSKQKILSAAGGHGVEFIHDAFRRPVRPRGCLYLHLKIDLPVLICVKNDAKEEKEKKEKWCLKLTKLCNLYPSKNRKTPLESAFLRPRHLRNLEIFAKDKKSNFWFFRAKQYFLRKMKNGFFYSSTTKLCFWWFWPNIIKSKFERMHEFSCVFFPAFLSFAFPSFAFLALLEFSCFAFLALLF